MLIVIERVIDIPGHGWDLKEVAIASYPRLSELLRAVAAPADTLTPAK